MRFHGEALAKDIDGEAFVTRIRAENRREGRELIDDDRSSY